MEGIQVTYVLLKRRNKASRFTEETGVFSSLNNGTIFFENYRRRQQQLASSKSHWLYSSDLIIAYNHQTRVYRKRRWNFIWYWREKRLYLYWVFKRNDPQRTVANPALKRGNCRHILEKRNETESGRINRFDKKVEDKEIDSNKLRGFWVDNHAMSNENS